MINVERDSDAPFADDAEHLRASLDGLDLQLLALAIRARRAAGGDPGQRGLFVDDEELSALLHSPAAEPLWARVPVDAELAELEAAAAAHREWIAGRERASRAIGRAPRLSLLADRFGLGRDERWILLLALAPELDLRYERIFGWLHDDVTRRRPSVQLALDVLAPGLAQRLTALALLSPGAELIDAGLVVISGRDEPLLRRSLSLETGVLEWLRGAPALAAAHRRQVTRRPPDPGLRERLRLAPALVERLDASQRERSDAAHERRALLLVGPAGVGRRSLAHALASAAGRPLLIVDGAAAAERDAAGLDRLLSALWRACRLEDAALCWTDISRLTEPQARALVRGLATRGPKLTLLTDVRAWTPVESPAGLPLIEELTLEPPSLDERISLWAQAVPDARREAHEAVARSVRFTPGKIVEAAATARGLARARGATTPNAGELLRAARRHATPRLGALATPVHTSFTWNQLVLPPEQELHLREIARRVTHEDTVLERWGFGRGLSKGGLSALFSGPPGTGKTMAAAIVAREVGRDLYAIDLSQVVSKFIGETEKQLERVFSEAEATDAALFFDEADALFGKRGEIRDAHDRYANIEVGYLLQRIESFPGLAILATNLRKNMDDAFLRRLDVIVEFPLPDVSARARIWRGIWPAEAPVDASVDPELLAERFQLSGGHIRNIALTAAFAAADAGSSITLERVLAAARREYRKLSKLVNDADFALP